MGSCATAGAGHATRGDKPHGEETSPEGGAGVQGWREALAGPEGRHGRGDTEMALRTGAFSRGATRGPFSTPSSLSCRRLFLITPREHSEADASDIYFLLRARPAQVTAGGTFLNERRKMSEQRSAATHPTDSRMSGNNTRIRFASAGRAYHPPVRRGELTVRRAEVRHQGSPRRESLEDGTIILGTTFGRLSPELRLEARVRVCSIRASCCLKASPGSPPAIRGQSFQVYGGGGSPCHSILTPPCDHISPPAGLGGRDWRPCLTEEETEGFCTMPRPLPICSD